MTRGPEIRPTELSTAVGDVIAKQRRRLGWSQEYLAQFSGTHASSVSKIECGRRATIAMAYQIASSLGLSGGEFFTLVDKHIKEKQDYERTQRNPIR